MTAPRAEVVFPSGGVRCAAWWYPPPGSAPAPCVVMGHGFGAIREAGLSPYAERFRDAGLGVLVFDYRHLGASEGEPRQLVDIGRQLADWTAAVAFARTLPEVDADRVALWGSSFSGGHVMVTAARDPAVAAVVAQVPFVDGVAALRAAGLRQSLRFAALGLTDQLAHALGRPTVLAPLVGPPGALAVMTAPGAEAGYRRLIPPEVRFHDRVSARVALRVGSYRPRTSAPRVRAPMLVCVATEDLVTPPQPAIAAARAAPRGELALYPGGHFDLYFDATFEQAVGDQTEFLVRHLGPA